MNAAEIYEEVRDWPREVWPAGVVMLDHDIIAATKPGASDPYDADPIRDDHAELMFEASGCRWLEDNGRVHACTVLSGWQENDDGAGRTGWLVNVNALDDLERKKDKITGDYWGPTRLAAISAAIRAVNEKE